MAKLATKTYSDALFELAIEKDAIDSLYEEALAVRKALSDNPDLLRLMSHPKVVREEKISIIEGIFKDRVSDIFCGFLVRIVTSGRQEMLPDILDYFIAQVKEYKKIGIAYVTTPTLLQNEQKKQIENRLLETTEYSQMEMHYDVDSSLIGGMRIRIGDKVVDSSVSTKLMQMSRQLHKIQLKNT